ncbi:hypothetical protein NMY22_g1507 [Coprinellus aureogranulatus]|nr:hypothetical protein NMY22_g1507 [Coprinellus aureogranulatus]
MLSGNRNRSLTNTLSWTRSIRVQIGRPFADGVGVASGRCDPARWAALTVLRHLAPDNAKAATKREKPLSLGVVPAGKGQTIRLRPNPIPERCNSNLSDESPTRPPGLKLRASAIDDANEPLEDTTIRLVGTNSSQRGPITRVEQQDVRPPLPSPTSWPSPTSSNITWDDQEKGRDNITSSGAARMYVERVAITSSMEAPIKPLKEPELSWFLTIVVMLSVTAAVSITADWLVESMDGISSTISKEWIALILLPAVSSIAECITSVRVSVKDELSLSVSVAIGSTIQTALLVVPLMVILGWVINKPLTLLMDPFESLVLYLSVQTTSYVLADGKSNWLEGVILIGEAVVSFLVGLGTDLTRLYPQGSTPLDFLTVCPHGA